MIRKTFITFVFILCFSKALFAQTQQQNIVSCTSTYSSQEDIKNCIDQKKTQNRELPGMTQQSASEPSIKTTDAKTPIVQSQPTVIEKKEVLFDNSLSQMDERQALIDNKVVVTDTILGKKLKLKEIISNKCLLTSQNSEQVIPSQKQIFKDYQSCVETELAKEKLLDELIISKCQNTTQLQTIDGFNQCLTEEILTEVSINKIKTAQSGPVSDQTELQGLSVIEKKLQPKYPLYHSEIKRLPIRQFGYDQLKSDGFKFDPIALPSIENDYILGPGDEILLFNPVIKEIPTPIIINRDGILFVPGLGEINIIGKTIANLRKELKRRSKLTKLTLTKLRSIQVNIVGEANQPGVHRLPAASNIISAFSFIGGIKKSGSLRQIQWRRGNRLLNTIDLYDYLIDGKEIKGTLKSGDTLFIPLVKKTIAIAGSVRRENIFEVLKEQTVAEILNRFAGGLLANARTDFTIVERISKSNSLVSEIIPLSISLDNQVISTSEIRNHDIYKILDGETAFKTVNLNGNSVLKQGPYPLHWKMTISDLIIQAGGNQRIPLDPKVTVWRWENKQDQMTRKVIELELDVLSFKTKGTFYLQENDEVFINQRADFAKNFKIEPIKEPQIRIKGDILKNSGTYLLLPSMTIKDAIKIAGGLVHDGIDSEVSVWRWQNTQDGVRRNIIKLELDVKTLKTKKSFFLQDNDEVFLRTRPQFARGFSIKDITKPTVWISGDIVNRNGTYPLVPNMTIKDVISIAGGLKHKGIDSHVTVWRWRNTQQGIQRKSIQLELDVQSLETVDQFYLQENDEVFLRAHPNFAKGLTINDVTTPRVWISGDILNKSGAYPLVPNMTIKDVISIAGGLKHKGIDSDITIWRWINTQNGIQRKTIKLEMDVHSLETIQQFYLQENDEIFLKSQPEFKLGHTFSPPIKPQIRISGNILLKSGNYALIPNMTIEDAIIAAGGLLNSAIDDQITVWRWKNTQVGIQRSIIDLELNVETLKTKIPFYLQENDEIFIRQRPEFTLGQQLTDILKPVVTIKGHIIKKPGSYPLVPNMTIKDAIAMAGGLVNLGIDSDVTVWRWKNTQQGSKKEVIHLKLDINTLESKSEFYLQTDDEVFLRKRRFYKESKIVEIKGEVLFPGEYPFEEGEKISDLINKAGGLTAKAFLPGAVFTRENILVQENTIDAVISKNEDKNLVQATLASAAATESTAQIAAITEIRSAKNAEEEKRLQQQSSLQKQEIEEKKDIQKSDSSSDDQLKEEQQELAALQKGEFEQSKQFVTVNQGRIILEIKHIGELKDSNKDINLQDGDVLHIPEVPIYVLIKGAVFREGALLIEE
ncbi:MAG: hypothetical protein HOC24_00130, partial [Deltaproteobacteria bacterium]|nr:hypothetical protein [Deltaproteobacteria bacterium]